MTVINGDTDTDLDVNLPIAEENAAPVEKVNEESIDNAIAEAFETVEGRTDENGQPRDPMGRFAAKQAEEAAAAAAKAAPVDPNAAVQQTGAMPSAWGRDKAELWAKTPPEVQAFIAQREQQISEGFKQYEGLAEFSELAQSNGRTLRDTLTAVRDIENLVMSDPLRGFDEIMRRSGMDPVKVARGFLGIQDDGTPSQQQGYQPPQIDPTIQRTIQQLQGQVQSLRMQPFQQQVETFASDPANKYFDRLIAPMQAIIASEKGLSLKDAYDRACWADPQVRAEMLKEQQVPVVKAQQLARSTQTAERASRGLAPSSRAPVKAPKMHMSIDEAINAAFQEYDA